MSICLKGTWAFSSLFNLKLQGKGFRTFELTKTAFRGLSSDTKLLGEILNMWSEILSGHTALGGGLVDSNTYSKTSIPVSLTFQIKLRLFPNSSALYFSAGAQNQKYTNLSHNVLESLTQLEQY